jgi:hypothetical protein
MLGVCDSAAQGERGSTKASQLHNDGARTDPQPAACTHHPPINRVVPVTVPMRARDAMQGRGSRCRATHPGSTLGSPRPTEAALSCHGRGSDVQRKLGSRVEPYRCRRAMRCRGDPDAARPTPPRQHARQPSPRRGCPRVPRSRFGRATEKARRRLLFTCCLLVRDTGAHATSDRQLHCEKNASERRRACHRSVQTDFCSRHGRGTQRRGRSGLYSASTFRVCERRAVSPDRRTEFRGGARDSPLLELAHRYAGSLASGASDAVQSVRPLGTDGLPSPTTSVQPTCTPIAIRAAERAQSSGGARAGLGGPRRIETDPKGPRNSGLNLRMVYPLLCFYPLLLPGGAIEIRENFFLMKLKLPGVFTSCETENRLKLKPQRVQRFAWWPPPAGRPAGRPPPPPTGRPPTAEVPAAPL